MATNALDHLSNRMKLEWYSQLNTEMAPEGNYRRTSIICTIGMSALCFFFWFSLIAADKPC